MPQDALTESKIVAKDREPRKPDRRAVSLTEVGKLFEKLPPHAIEAEMSLLGSMLLDPAVVGDVIQVIRSGDDFYSSAHGAIFDTIVELYDKHSTLDLITLNQILIDRDVLSAVGGPDYLAEIGMSVPTAAHAPHYARMVRDKAIIRQLIQVAGEVIHDAYNSPERAQEILDRSEHRIFHIAERYESTDFSALIDILNQQLKFIQDNDGPISGLLTGYADFDDLTGGLQPGELTILAARPSMGKTALALNLVEQIARQNHPVGLFSLEMSKGQLVQRLVSGRAGVDVQRIRRNMLSREELPRVASACAALAEMPVFVDDMASITLLQLRAKARRMASKHGIKAIFVDYLQLVSLGVRTESRQIEVSEISRGLKALARELEVPVVCMAQLNRGPEQREGHRPRLSDLRESGSIEQDADVVMLLHREDYYHKDDPAYQHTNTADLIIAKQRNGPTGVVGLIWDSTTTTFRNRAFDSPPPEFG
ncbi:MAG: replicative DNA helicase [Phycisphaerales bacterium]